jgi:aminoglycoside phosphotransferase (APT) family kinase protein
VPEPQVLGELEREDELGQGFFMEWLEGETLGSRIVKSDAFAAVRPRLARECGEILARIHAIDVKATGLDQKLTRLDPKAFVEQTWGAYKFLKIPQPMIDYAGRWLLDNVPDDPTLGLVHSDFRNGNLMVSDAGITAVLDWELAHIGDPMRDLGWICTNSWRFGRSDLPVGGFGTYDDLFAGYESVSGVPVDPDRVHFWEVFGSFWWAVGCLGMGSGFREGPDPSIERAAVGRRSSECQVDCVNLLIPGPVEVLEPVAQMPNLDLPRVDELVTGVRDFLRGDVMEGTEGRVRFMARVASNALDIVARDLVVGERHRSEEHKRLRDLLACDDTLEALRWQLVEALRDDKPLPVDAEGLAHHLRTTVINQIAIDQPRYSGFLTSISDTHQPS